MLIPAGRPTSHSKRWLKNCAYGRMSTEQSFAHWEDRRDVAFDRGWIVNDKRVERIWRRESLKVSAKQPKQGRFWLADGSCIRAGAYARGASRLDERRAGDGGRARRPCASGASPDRRGALEAKSATRLDGNVTSAARTAKPAIASVIGRARSGQRRAPWIIRLRKSGTRLSHSCRTCGQRFSDARGNSNGLRSNFTREACRHAT